MKKAAILFLLILGFLLFMNCAPDENNNTDDPTPGEEDSIKLDGNRSYPLSAFISEDWPDIGTGKVVLKLGITCKVIFHGLNGVADISGDWNYADWVKDNLEKYKLEIKLDTYQRSHIFLYPEGVDWETEPNSNSAHHVIEFNVGSKPEE